MKLLIQKLEKKRKDYEDAFIKLNKQVKTICDFNASLVYVQGDGHCILNEDTTSVAPLANLKLDDKSQKNKLSSEEHSWCSG